ncbi:MAG: Rrf2 family transcriptional regulator [Melioribacteraceae bacterium]|jgi:Rrf2 family protein|nr:Rrf2 family transcriptional regulator [Melioribacteraceae bacterium]RJP57410.1 MAG: Rrf2 family transcriptional regulator [Ignavibacteriales bacterium]WKZ70750.1 MAG: Rrf2 family transcriptional regulator [Melioribacteraceae bacterium]
MLKIAKSVEYSILALRFIANNQSLECISTKEISIRENIPYDLLAKLMQKMVRNKIIISKQGKLGGYALNISPENLSINDVILALDEKVQLTDCMVLNPTEHDCGRVTNCCLRSPLSKMQEKIIDLFKQTTLKEILN